MNKTQLESKHIAELHDLAAEAGVERYRMLSRAELIEKLAGDKGGAQPKPQGERRGGDPGRGRQRDRGRSRAPREERRPEPEESPEPEPEPRAPEPGPQPEGRDEAERPRRKRRRRRWGRRRKGVRVHDLLLPAAPGRRAIVYAESRAACTALLREVAAELSEESNGPDPIALLVDPSPEELADWKREAPKAEIVSAGKANHAEDAIAQAQARARGGEDVFVLIDSLTRFAEAFAGAEEARELFDAGNGGGKGTLTVLAAIERQS
ncbi:MAG TPA: Rho termination factor N-terminal domain-containing protein [Solirubrobacterales bacterium]|nr:Rho termination factor N-terminal domain-containing protein [Solirubrobacterales bacterium]